MKHKASLLLCILSIFIMSSCNNDDELLNQIDEQNNNPTKGTIDKDGTKMVLIPAGEFQMGSNDFWGPVHTVYLDAFYMDVYEVTNAQYKKFMYATRHEAPEFWNDSSLNAPNQPVVGVRWDDAVAYAKWVGKRLPTEAEWEKAARGGLVGKKYPWGDTLTHDDANDDGTGGKDVWNGASPVGSFNPNGYGLYDMAGNVEEWCADWFDLDYYAYSPKSNPMGPSYEPSKKIQWHVCRGGSWEYTNGDAYDMCVSNRSNCGNYFYTLGFRCGASRSD